MTSRAGGTVGGCQGERPLRRDAERNRQRILRAAGEVFTQRGLDATLDDVARHAGVGVGTVYRRFPDKETLIAELFQARIDALVTVAETACAAPDPWRALVSFLEHTTAAMAGDLGLRQLMMFAAYGRDRVAYARERMRPVITTLVERAQAAGVLRPDLDPTDIPMITFLVASAAEYSGPVQPDLWRRYLTLVIDGMSPSRATVSELGVPALTSDEMERSMRAHAQRSTAHR